ncbi:DUF2059 domain-containing protein [Caulobacter segnis]|uniref:DUF2059 domain-containing protein n=1 Tax=Caulobacter segnis TaxID=88688 RepID=UPI00240FFA9A|nr:DUF2059 domain-containing protein [Caulobacter segnis]MDG2520175.1 DUF2059 domain-containing protein [Caulobacter segnis]
MNTTLLAALAVLGLTFAAPALATEKDVVEAERFALCARSVDLAGMRDDMDAKIAAIVDEVSQRITPFAENEKSVEAYKTALGLALDGGKAVVVQRVIETCATTFTIEELNGINAFYVSPAGKAWLEKGRTVMMPALEGAIAEVQPQIEAEMQARFCAAIGGCALPEQAQRLPGKKT